MAKEQTKKAVKKAAKKKAIKAAKKVVEAPKPVTVPLDELYVYKLQLLDKKLEEAQKAITAPLQALYEQELAKRVSAALKQDPATQEAFNARVDCINEVMDKVTPSLPEGYAVSLISPENAVVTAEFNPEQVDQRLEKKL